MNTRLSIICIWVSFILLLIMGIMMVTSTGLCATVGPGESPEDFIIKQSRFAILGIAVAIGLSIYDYHNLRNWVCWIWGISVVLLVFCYIPGIGMRLNGESRWINIGFSFQPSELAKISLMLALAHWYTTHREMAGTFWKGFVVPGALIYGFPLVLILMEKDMGTTAALAMSGFCVMYAAGSRWWLIVLAVLMGALVLYLMTTSSPNRMLRIEAWEDPYEYRQGPGRQQWAALLALARGDILGVGLGNGIEKYGSLPFAHTDFIFAEIGEEWGFFGTAGVLFLYTLMAISGIMLALQTQETFGRILALGLVCTIFWPAALNMMVVTSMLPNSGLPLPFISYGGTNLVVTIATIGLLTSIQRHTPIIQQNYWPQRRIQENPKL